MDRTEDLFKIIQIYQPDAKGMARGALQPDELSLYQRIALRVSSNLDHNDLLMKRMDVLAGRKEFSNDPTAAMAEISDLFQKTMSAVKVDMDQLKRLSDGGMAQVENSGPHQHQHYKLVFQALNKRMLKHIDSFQHAIKVQSSHVEQRTKRVADKYGQGTSQMSKYVATKDVKDTPLSGSAIMPTQKYAMFARPPPSASHAEPAPIMQSHELRRRAGGSVASSSAANGGSSSVSFNAPSNKGTTDNKYLQRSPYGGGEWSGPNEYMQQQLIQQPPSQQSSMRLKVAQRAEAQIAQMGALFQQMASLVVEQSETISRIEDDVENGLVDTKEGHKHLVKYYELSKSNRSMILKVFALLVFFVLLFCWFF